MRLAVRPCTASEILTIPSSKASGRASHLLLRTGQQTPRARPRYTGILTPQLTAKPALVMASRPAATTKKTLGTYIHRPRDYCTWHCIEEKDAGVCASWRTRIIVDERRRVVYPGRVESGPRRRRLLITCPRRHHLLTSCLRCWRH